MVVGFLLSCITFLLSCLPHRIALSLGWLVGDLGYLADRRHRRLAIANIQCVFGQEKTAAEIRRIARQSFHHLGMNFIEFLRGLPREVEILGRENYCPFLEKKQGMIFIIGHLGNWEVLGRVAAREGVRPLVAVGRDIKNKAVDAYIKGKRKHWQLEILGKKGCLPQLIESLRAGKNVAILIDQYAGRRAIFVDFLGRPTSTTASPAVLALRTGAPLIPVFMIRQNAGRYQVIVERPMEVVSTDNLAKDLAVITQRMVRPLEKYIRQFPEQWWWVHRRWRDKKEVKK